MSIFSFFKSKAKEVKESVAAVTFGPNKDSVKYPFGKQDYRKIAKEAYTENWVVYRSIRLIAENAAKVEWQLRDKNTQAIVEDSELLDLLKKPNPMQGNVEFMRSTYSHLALSGNSYIEGAFLNEREEVPFELYSHAPDLIKIIQDSFDASRISYEYTNRDSRVQVRRAWTADFDTNTGSVTRENDVTFVAGIPMLHMKLFSPLDYWYGLSPIVALAVTIDQYQEGQQFNWNFLQQGAKLAGIITLDDALTNEQTDTLLKSLEKYQGAENAGKFMVVGGGKDFIEVQSTFADMEFAATQESLAKNISAGLGVPYLLLQPEGATFANLKEAKQYFWEETVLPLIDLVISEFNNWLVPMFNDGVELFYDKAQIEALISRQQEKMMTLNEVDFLTDNEKRAKINLEEVLGGDDLYKPSSEVPIGMLSEESNEVEGE